MTWIISMIGGPLLALVAGYAAPQRWRVNVLALALVFPVIVLTIDMSLASNFSQSSFGEKIIWWLIGIVGASLPLLALALLSICLFYLGGKFAPNSRQTGI